jgi:hypothetical protein
MLVAPAASARVSAAAMEMEVANRFRSTTV